jgi:hypothetical protein
MLGFIAALLMFGGIAALVYGILRKMKAGRLTDAPLVSTGDASARGAEVANPKGSISAQGRLICQQPLVSPVTGKQCIYYRVKVTEVTKSGDETKEKTIEDVKMAAQFALDDGSGPVWIDATKGGVNDDQEYTSTAKEIGIIGGLTGNALQFGNYSVQAGILSIGTKYVVEETLWPLPASGSMYACGKSNSNTIAPPGWRELIVSNKSRDELLEGVTKAAKQFSLGGGAVTGVGALTAVLAATVFASAPAAPKSVAVGMTTTHAAVMEIPPPVEVPSMRVEDLPVAKPAVRAVVKKK